MKNKKSIYALSAVIVAIALVAFGVFYQPQAQAENPNYTYGFEDGFDGWTADADVPDNPNNPGHPVNWTIESSDNVSYNGNKSMSLFIDGSQDDGTIWIQRKINLTPNTTNNVSLSFQLWSSSESFNTLAMVVGNIGTEKPAAEADFQTLGAANQLQSWKTYTLNNSVNTDGSGEVYVALGISVCWETQLTYYIDDIVIDVN